MVAAPPILLRRDPPVVPPTASGSYMLPQGIAGDVRGSFVGIGNWLSTHVIVIPHRVTIDAFSLYLLSGSGTLRIRLGLYELDATTGYPGTLVTDIGEQGPGLSSPQLVTWPVSPAWSPEPGSYGVCIATNETCGMATMSQTLGSLIPFGFNVAGPAPIYAVWVMHLYSALPATYPTTGLFLVATIGGFQVWPRIQ